MSWATNEATRKSMLGNRSRDTHPELLVRRALHARGMRFRVDLRPESALRTRADIVFTRRRIAVYIDGCFWHGCPDHGTTPKSNVEYWTPKLARNVERDAESTLALEALGWTVLRFWSHEQVDAVVARISAHVAPGQSDSVIT
ncbi:DNA mismatch endonuclease (patch repair protein) [Conyzicola lurida]|uniref:DNA mismatch endonuclease (Patch repair protein) n=1 Tax=Conyzicola lurida TaxID=1172621 RepID=A0A841AIJ8_9MICO|nr:very short patch repair endonuclease [Conyzicola lurida]MBB5843057.1 DNA mismatch endonuclease (patch repair protein) [Conyzicola lurida]